MWNSSVDRKLILKPADVYGLCTQWDMKISGLYDLKDIEPDLLIEEPYDRLVHKNVLVYEGLRLIHTLVTDTPVLQGGHTAIEEAMLHGLLLDMHSWYTETPADDDYLSEGIPSPAAMTINAVLRLDGKKKRVKRASEIGRAQWRNVVNRIFFHDEFDWELIHSGSLATLNTPIVQLQMGIHPSYFDMNYRVPTPKEIRKAYTVFSAIRDAGQKQQPVKDLPAIPSLSAPRPVFREE